MLSTKDQWSCVGLTEERTVWSQQPGSVGIFMRQCPQHRCEMQRVVSLAGLASLNSRNGVSLPFPCPLER